MFLSANTTSLIQPMYHSVIYTIMVYTKEAFKLNFGSRGTSYRRRRHKRAKHITESQKLQYQIHDFQFCVCCQRYETININ